MMEHRDFEATFAAIVETIDAATLMGGGKTIAPPLANDSVSELLARASDGVLRDGTTIGEGGMGIVRESEQLAVGRSIAVKTLKAEQRSNAAILKLLQEAWITGALEHPNIVPIYDVQVSGGVPRILLKRIEGKSWADELYEEGSVLSEAGLDDARLERHLRILLQVARAAHFAHTRGFLHRDIKPENVMLGAHGEVYLLDWGIAVALDDDGSGRFPMASEQHHMAGTPAYMAPEQLGGREPNLGAHTDVFLLGATLYEILTGHAPNRGDGDIRSLLQSVFQCEHELPPSVPPGLRAIVNTALQMRPEDRFESADAFRTAVEAFLEHRGSERLVERAARSQAALTSALEAEDDDAVDSLYRECVFGYQAALEAWPQNTKAREQLDGITVIRAAYAIERGHLGSARSALRTLSGAAPRHLQDALEKAERKVAQKESDLSRLRDDVDFAVAIRTRTFLIATFGAFFVGAPLLQALYRPTIATAMIGVSVQVVILTGLMVWARDSMLRTRLNRALGLALFSIGGASLVWIVTAYLFDFHVFEARLGLYPIWSLGAVVAASALGRAHIPFALGFIPAFIVSAWDIRYFGFAAAGASALAFGGSFCLHLKERRRLGIPMFGSSTRGLANEEARSAVDS